MNIIWNVIKKDLRHNWLMLCLLYIAGFVAHAADKWPGLSDQSHMPLALNSIKTVAGLAGGILCLVFIGVFVQDDPASAPSSFWRTRPLTSFQMLVAKWLLLVGFLEIGPPIFGHLVMCLVKFSLSPLHFHLDAEFVKGLFIGNAFVAVSAALAATTKNLSQYLLAAVLTGFVFMGLFICFVVTKVVLPSVNVPSSHVIVTALIIFALGATAFCQQYIARRTWLSVMLVLFCPATFALLTVFWR